MYLRVRFHHRVQIVDDALTQEVEAVSRHTVSFTFLCVTHTGPTQSKTAVSEQY